jgi:nucleotidyltransferase/DNA polymerase involved in DNA repair
MIGRPIIIGGLPHERKTVYDVSEEAIKYGIKRGMPLRQAYALCPQGLFLPSAQEKYNNAFTHVLALLANHSPMVEAMTLAYAFIDVTYEHDETRFAKNILEIIERQTHFRASTGIASNKFVAQMASQIAKPGQPLIIAEGEEREFLKELPVDSLPISFESLRRLKLLGIHEMGELSKLPCKAINLQFGGEGRRLWELATGIDGSKLMPWSKVDMLKEEFCFEPPAESLSFLLAKADELLGKLSWQLKQRWQYCRKLTMSLSFTNGHLVQRVFHFKEATSSQEIMLRHLRHCLEKARFMAPVNEMRLTLTDFCPEEGKQTSFLNKSLRRKEKLASAIHGLQGRYDEGVVKKVLFKRNVALPEDSFSFIKLDLEDK